MTAIMSIRDLYLSNNLLDEFLVNNTETSYILKNILVKINKNINQNLQENDLKESTSHKRLAIEHNNKSDNQQNQQIKQKASAVVTKQSQTYKHKLKLYKNFLNDNKDCHKTRKQIQQELRDKLRLEEHGIGFSISDIVDSNSEEFNELIRVKKPTVEQLALVKDIRRRGKNKLAAQTCRKRKLESIDSLKEDVDTLTEALSAQETQNDRIKIKISELFDNFDELYEDIMLNLPADSEPNPILLNLRQIDSDMKELKESVRSITSEATIECRMPSVESFESHMEESQDFYDEMESEDGEESESMSVGSSQSSTHNNRQTNNVKHSFFIENLIEISNN